MASVLNVLYDERVGGPQLRVLQVARRLKDKGIGTIVVMPKGDPKFRSLLEQERIPFHEMDLVRLRKSFDPREHLRFAAKFWPNVVELRWLIREHHVEIVHTNGLMNLQAAIAAHQEGVGLLWHLNDTSTPWLLRKLYRPLVGAWADQVALAAEALGPYYALDPKVFNGRLQIVYAPVDIHRFHPRVDGSARRQEFGIPESATVIGTVANLQPGKGYEYLLEAAPLIRERFPGTKFLLVGRPLQNRQTFVSALHRRVAELGLQSDVIFTGHRQDIPELMRAMTVYMHPADRGEACPIAVLEASASGLPVVATDSGGTRELIEDGVTGIVISPRSVSQIAETAIRLLKSPEDARRMGEKAAERMRTLFSLDACVEAHARMYNALLNRVGKSASTAREETVMATEKVEDVYSRD